MLLCITPAPAIDRTAYVERISFGEVLRPTRLLALAGGKGVNAARAASHLGAEVITSGIAGGYAGRWLVDELTSEGLRPHFSAAAAESRTSYVIVDSAGRSVLLYERPGPASQAEFEEFLSILEHELLPLSGRAIVAGTLPAGLPAREHGRIVEASRRAGRPLLVDASGPGLLAALEAGPDIVKIGRAEAAEAGLVDADAAPLQAALSIVEAGARLAIVTDGADPVVAADAHTTWQLSVPPVEAVNAVGSGDAFNAALSMALMDGASTEVALRKGVAAGSANALAFGAGMLEASVAHELEGRVTVSSSRRS